MKIQAPQAWGVTRGAGVAVAVVDTGADVNHPDLAANLVDVSGSDLLQNTAYVCPFQKPGRRTSTALAQDDNGHGTHVSGIIAAVTGNGLRVAGTAPDARVMPVEVLDKTCSGTDADVARGSASRPTTAPRSST